MLYFSAARFLFMAYQRKLGGLLGAMVHGWHMDLSMTGYCVLLAAVLLALLWPLSAKWHRRILDATTLVLLIPLSIVILADMELYRHWGFRIDATPLLYLRTPKEAMASTPIGTAILMLLALGLLVYLSFRLYKLLCHKHLNNTTRGYWWFTPIFMVLAGCTALPIRGGLGIAPMNPCKVFFSTNLYKNHAALNAPWNMLYSLTLTSDINHRRPDTVTAEEAQSNFDNLMYACSDSVQHLLRTQRPNVVVILLESFTAKAVGFCGGLSGITPCLDTLAHQGIAYTHIYAAGDRSDKGIVASLTGLPAQSENSVIKYPSKTAQLPSISQKLHQLGYSTTFYYGGDPTFANIQSLMYQCEFERIVAHNDFPPEQRNSKWGAHDEYVFDRMLAETDTAKPPFFKMIFTLTSHEPFELPRQPQGYLNRPLDELFLNSIHYTDSCLGRFVAQARQRSWWDNTLLVLIADHGHPRPMDDANHTVRKFHIPMLWIGGALACEPHEQPRVGSQIDLPATLLSQLSIDYSDFLFSKDINNPTTSEFAHYTFNHGYGFITAHDTLIYDHISQQPIKTARTDAVHTNAGAFFYKYQDYFLQLGQF